MVMVKVRSGLVIVGACRQDPPDPRDLDFADLRERLKVGASSVAWDEVVMQERTPVSDQGRRPTCVANAACDALELVMATPVQLSRLFAYKNSRLLHDGGSDDSGTYGRICWKQLNKIGACPESMWPYDERPEEEGGVVNERPPLGCYEAAYDHRVEGYYAIRTTGAERGNDVDAAVRLDHPVFLAMQVGREFCDWDGTGNVVWNAPSRPIGRHAMVVVGVRRDSLGRRHFLLRSSWGKGWGEDGYAWATEGWVCDPFTSDLWVPTMAPSFTVED